MTTAHLALGSNLGDRAGLLRAALSALARDGRVRIAAVSSVYETAPVGGPRQPDYLNLVATVETDCGAEALLARCLAVEAEQGRVRRERWGPRTLDLDVLTYGDVALATERLTLPHPRMAERAFVIVPLAEIAPAQRVAGSTAADLAARLDTAGVRRLGRLETLAPGQPEPTDASGCAAGEPPCR